jgi:hypothetical protein
MLDLQGALILPNCSFKTKTAEQPTVEDTSIPNPQCFSTDYVYILSVKSLLVKIFFKKRTKPYKMCITTLEKALECHFYLL